MGLTVRIYNFHAPKNQNLETSGKQLNPSLLLGPQPEAIVLVRVIGLLVLLSCADGFCGGVCGSLSGFRLVQIQACAAALWAACVEACGMAAASTDKVAVPVA